MGQRLSGDAAQKLNGGACAINSGMKPRTTTNWERLLKALDAEYSIPNAVASTVKKVGKTYDPDSHEHVFTLEYRARVLPELNYRSVRTESLLSSVLGNP